MIQTLPYRLFLFAAATAITLGLSCNKFDSDKGKKISLEEIKQIIHPSYFAPCQIAADVVVKTKSSHLDHKYQGFITIDRDLVSRLSLHTKNQFVITISKEQVTVEQNADKPMILDLANVNHDVSVYRELSVLEPNPFRYLDDFYTYRVKRLSEGCSLIKAAAKSPVRGANQIRIEVDSTTKMIKKIEFYSQSGDLFRRVKYDSPVKISGVFIATKVIMDSVEGSEVINEVYTLNNLHGI